MFKPSGGGIPSCEFVPSCGGIPQMMRIYEQTESSVIGVQRVPQQDVSRYGVIQPRDSIGPLHAVEHLVEKPRPEHAPSNLAIIGRYILTPAIFDFLAVQEPGAGGEIQLTDALEVLNRASRVHAYEFNGTRYDVGEVPGFVKATIEFALRDPSMREEIWHYLRGLTPEFAPQ
jgi:UTP--glucose-1-phosphate uridylyltransferase